MNKLALSSDIAMKIDSANEYLSNNEIQTSSKLLDVIIALMIFMFLCFLIDQRLYMF